VAPTWHGGLLLSGGFASATESSDGSSDRLGLTIDIANLTRQCALATKAEERAAATRTGMPLVRQEQR
jgi:hypothetical protein